MYYVISTVDNNNDTNKNDRIEIRKKPAVKEWGGEFIIEGDCGGINGISITAHGCYKTLDDAISFVNDHFIVSNLNECDFARFIESDDDDDLCIACRIGEYTEMDEGESADWAYDLIKKDIKKYTSDDKILELFDSYQEDAQCEGATLDDSLIDHMKDHRDELKNEQ